VVNLISLAPNDLVVVAAVDVPVVFAAVVAITSSARGDFIPIEHSPANHKGNCVCCNRQTRIYKETESAHQLTLQ
jgi:hypothetical protein